MSVVERLSTNFLTVRKPLLELFETASDAKSNTTGDIGFFSSYYDSGLKYTGLFRDESDTDNSYTLFQGLSVKPTNNDTVNTAGAGFGYANLKLGILDVRDTTQSTSSTTGSAKFAGGVGIAGNLNVAGSLNISGSSITLGAQQVSIYDNIVVDNVSDADGNYAGDDSGYVSGRVPINISAHDTAKVSNVALASNFLANATEVKITNAAVGNDYYVGWAIKKNSGEIRLITADTDNGGSHTLTLESAFGSAGTAGSTTFSLFNKTNVGWIWNEQYSQLSAVAFPRDNLSVLDYKATDGSAPEYLDIKVGNLTVNGTLTSYINPIKAMELDSATTLTKSQISEYSIYYMSSSLGSDVTVSLPDTSSFNDSSTVSYQITIANLSSRKITIQRQGSDVIDGLQNFIMENQYDKMSFISYVGGWLIV